MYFAHNWLHRKQSDWYWVLFYDDYSMTEEHLAIGHILLKIFHIDIVGYYLIMFQMEEDLMDLKVL